MVWFAHTKYFALRNFVDILLNKYVSSFKQMSKMLFWASQQAHSMCSFTNDQKLDIIRQVLQVKKIVDEELTDKF